MNGIEIIESSLLTAERLALMYLDDLSDEDLMQRPGLNCNTVNWQLGHLILSDHRMLAGWLGDRLPDLPTGFAQRYDKQNAAADDPKQFDTKEQLLQVYHQQRQSLLQQLKRISEDDLQTESDAAIRGYAPTVGVALSMLPIHWMMHVGQWIVLRRQLGREVLI